ncbi:MAG: DNA alkylation repair protein [Lentisphaerae bacterium GWF2_52_8]|nr:MAG: DNA alkylation repair protein [Lentisphaerae bacterium GWF2_52_8]
MGNKKTFREIQGKLKKMASPQEAAHSQRFFKTGKGEYGEGDIFRGIRVPPLRKLAKDYMDIPLGETALLLQSKFHEDRALALMILVKCFAKGNAATKKEIYSLYTANTAQVNNWDLVDISAEHIIGGFLFDKSKKTLIRLAKSKSLWERRIAIISTFHFIRKRHFDDTLRIAALLINDEHDLIHKAVGWMLREIGKRNISAEESFLKEHYTQMPRTMLRYAIEKFPEQKRLAYLRGDI